MIAPLAATLHLPHRGGRHRERRRPRRRATWRSPTRTATRPCSASNLTVTSGRAGRHPRPQRRRQDHASSCTSTARSAAARAAIVVDGLPVEKAEPARDPPPRRDRVPGPRRPALLPHRPRRRRLRPGQPRLSGPRARAPGRGRAARGRDGRPRRAPAAPPQLRSAPPGRGEHGAVDGPVAARARRAVVEPRPAGARASSPRSCSGSN